MYHPKVIERNISQVESELKLTLIRYDLGEVEAWVEHLDKRKKLLESKLGRPITVGDLKSEEQAFIRNEILLCAHDFSYWSERYCWLIADPDIGEGSGLRRMKYTEGQELLLHVIAGHELEQTDASARGETVDGILLACHKTRQHGITMLARAILIHRVITTPHTRAIGGSIDEEKVLKLYERDKRIYDHLPWWMQIPIQFEEKGKHITWERLDSSLLYQELVQKAGIAQGEQYDAGHFTEVASVPYFHISLENDYQPTIPRVPSSLHILETTPLGRDNWWRFFVEEVRKGKMRWKPAILPWYIGLRKYRRTPPADWTPSELAMNHAEKIWRTSEATIGRQVMLSRENVYWWETSQEAARRNDSLQYFYTNYWATVEESFQHTTDSVFSADLLDYYRTQTREGVPYEFRTGEVA